MGGVRCQPEPRRTARSVTVRAETGPLNCVACELVDGFSSNRALSAPRTAGPSTP
jgi:hypothetical protein